jgi:ribosome maturation factor RimP
MDLAGRIEELVRPTIEAMGFSVVRVQITGKQRPRVQVMVERQDGQPMQVDDCARISRQLSPLLDVEDVIAGAYTLEVSSPGIDRPLVRLADFDRFAGHQARIETGRPIDGRKRFLGRLAGRDGDRVRLVMDTGEIALPFADIVRAKLVLTEELLASTAGDGAG